MTDRGINHNRPLPPTPPRKEKSEQEKEQAPSPRAAEIAAERIRKFETKTSPRKQFPIIDRQKALQQKTEQKLVEHLRQYSGEHEIEIVESTGERPKVETVVLSAGTSPRPPAPVVIQKTAEREVDPEELTFREKLARFEGSLSVTTRTTTTTTTSSPPPDVQSPRRITLGELPALEQRQSEKPS